MRYPQGLNVCISVSQLYPEFNSKSSAIMPSAHRRAATIELSSGTDPEFSSDSDSDDSDAELIQVRAALAPAPPDATSQELRKALKISQRLLLDLRGKCCEAIKKNALLEAAVPKGHKRHNLTSNDLAMAAKEDTIRALGRKYSITHCLWINIELFPLSAHTCPDIDLNSKERWLTGVSMEDGVRAELFKFIPEEERELMSYQNFGSQFGRGVSNAHSEMASDVKSCASAIFGLNASIFIRGYKRNEDPNCRPLLLSPHGEYTKFAPVLFPRPDNPVPASVVENCKACAGLESAASSRTKAKIWKLRAITPGMIAAAAVVAIFLLSGDAELTEIGDTTKIPYREYHNFYHQRLLTGGAWAHQVITFFNDALFSGTSSYVPPSTALNDDGLGHTWEEDFNRAIEDELEEPVVDDSTPPIPSRHANDNTNSGNVQVNELLPVSHHTSAPSIPAPSISAPPQAVAAPPIAAPPVVTAPPVINMARSSESITTAMDELNLRHQDLAESDLPAPTKARAKPKARRKGKTTAEGEDEAVVVRQSGRKGK
ncbi:hypothetical protein DFJ58DRAFT_837427 [Suillus subalutaceus]|uniref:uncharacterized protein n=1 Tax=Suillus subalutaceus TaxID=48586 RepID=UPI001B872225|nr:uncharacterized protein DFJ58DRAFT_837427 [Suillus subalutaceus]KAG1870705.1 hypothetical protein DFJ58DRAFT_837427 [Suillus subalutaceus]